MKDMPKLYRLRLMTTTVGDVIWGAKQEVVALARECFGASRKMTAGWAPKAEEFQTAAENLAAIATMRLQGMDGYAAGAEHEVFHVELWEPYKRIPTARWVRALNQVLAMRALGRHLASRTEYAKLCEELEQAAGELEQVQFPDMAGHNWNQPRPDSGRQVDPTRVS